MDLLYKRDINEISKLFDGKNILITGGTGSFGNKLIDILLKETKPNKIIVFSRDEFKQYHMSKKFSPDKYPCMRYFIGDIRDLSRLNEAFKNIDIVFHAAALKHVPIIEYNPNEAIKTNIYGTENIVKAAINNNVERVIALSTDKCVSPANLYGATKLCLEKLIISGNHMSGNKTKFSVLRYGNVFASRGSVVPLFIKQAKEGLFTITDKKMTRFTLLLEEAINFVLDCSINMIGGEIFIPKLPSYNICQLANVIAPNVKIDEIGIRPGEKLHESMIGEYESYLAIENDDKYIILPPIYTSNHIIYTNKYGNKFCTNGFIYSSDNNELISDERLLAMIDLYKKNNKFY
jgi:UDP-N-acetylglucosamine 4,6-dehydratase/5-epimerase